MPQIVFARDGGIDVEEIGAGGNGVVTFDVDLTVGLQPDMARPMLCIRWACRRGRLWQSHRNRGHQLDLNLQIRSIQPRKNLVRDMANNFVLREYLPYLLNRAGVKIGLAFSCDIAPYNITLQMWRVLVALWENGDQRLNELSVLTSVDPSTLSRLLVNMQRRRLIVRRRSGDDARALSLRLTAKGRHIATKLIPLAHHYEMVAVSGFSKADIKRLKRLLTKIDTNIETSDLGHAEHQDKSSAVS